MTWLLLAITPPLLWSIVNHIDKYLLSKSHHKSSVDVLMVYSTGFSLFILPFLYILARQELLLDIRQILIQVFGGVLMTVSIYFYLKALYRDEASVVIPFALLVPVFGYFFSYFFLGEILSKTEILACLLIFFGAAILSFEINEETKFKLNHGVLFFMIICTSAQALQETLFKFATIEHSFFVSLFWLHIGIAICGIFLVLSRRHLFSHFIESVRLNGRFMFGVNFVSEFVSSVAYIIRNYAILLAPVVVVMTLNGFQPAFVFIIGTVLTVLFPGFVKEKIKPVHLLHKGTAITIMIIGAIIIAQAM